MSEAFSVESILFKDTFNSNTSNVKVNASKSMDELVYDAYKSEEELKFFETYDMLNTYNTNQKIRMLKRLNNITNNIRNKNISNSCESYIRSLEEDTGKKQNIFIRIFEFIKFVFRKIFEFIKKIVSILVEKIKKLFKINNISKNASKQEKEEIKTKLLTLNKSKSKEDLYSIEWTDGLIDKEDDSHQNYQIYKSTVDEKNATHNTKNSYDIDGIYDSIAEKVNDLDTLIHNDKNSFIKYYYYDLFSCKTFNEMSKFINDSLDKTMDEMNDLYDLFPKFSTLNTEIRTKIQNIYYNGKIYPNTSFVGDLHKDCNELMKEMEYSRRTNDHFDNEKTYNRQDKPTKEIIENIIKITLESDFFKTKKFFDSVNEKLKNNIIKKLTNFQNLIEGYNDSLSKFVENLHTELSKSDVDKSSIDESFNDHKSVLSDFSKCSSRYSKLCIEKINTLTSICKINNKHQILIDTFMNAVIKCCHYN